MNPPVLVTEAALKSYCTQLLQKVGVPAEDAAIVTDNLVQADLRGVEFLIAREARGAAAARLGQHLAKLDALNLPPLSDAEIEAEIQAERQDRMARRA